MVLIILETPHYRDLIFSIADDTESSFCRIVVGGIGSGTMIIFTLDWRSLATVIESSQHDFEARSTLTVSSFSNSFRGGGASDAIM